MKKFRSIAFVHNLRRSLRLFPVLSLFFVFTALYFFPFSSTTSVTIVAPAHEPLYSLFETTTLNHIMLEADDGRHDSEAITHFAEELSHNVSVRTGYDGCIVIRLVHFHSDVFALTESDFLIFFLFLAQSYIQMYTYTEAKALFINITPLEQQSSSDTVDRLSSLKDWLSFAIDCIEPSTDVHEKPEEEDVYFSELCKRISLTSTPQVARILENLYTLREHALEFANFLNDNEDYLLYYPSLAEQEMQKLYDDFMREISEYNVIVMQTAQEICSKYIFIEKIF